jgi:hypothetical protein
MQGGIHSTLHTSTECRINTVVSPDDGHMVARNMYRLINVLRINLLRINCAPSWLYIQDSKSVLGLFTILCL